MATQIKEQTKEINESFSKQMEEKLQPLIDENKKLKEELVLLKEKVDYLETEKKKNNIIVFGMPENETSNENKGIRKRK
ncbi:hypothetical protein RR46_13682 [Papilio xuthus]|uniref:Uncharacterized protein n=1 Tax=Papilio xuthus TaxID=66420 RepID=A0A194PGE5_PAPXU|nr:hypothetical protein RR46_13682 [Papilio xuthus]